MADTTFEGAAAGGAQPPAAAAGDRLIDFIGRRTPLLGILLSNTVLSLITLGIYRFWARTRLRKFFWGSIEIDGDPLEYTGRGVELFIGFLIVISILVPLSIGYTVVSIFLESWTPDFADAVNFLYFVGLLWLARYAFFRARRYRLGRTVWRGIRAGQDGSAATYAFLWLGYVIFSILTLGWGVPWMTAALQEYEVENARFGNENFRYAGSGGGLLRSWMPCGALWSLAIVMAIGLTITSAGEIAHIIATIENITEDNAAVLPGFLLRLLEIYGLVIFTFIVSIPFYVVYRIAALRYMFNVSSLAGAQFTAHFGAWRVFGYWLAQFLVTVGVVIGFVLVLALVMALLERSIGVDLSSGGAGDGPFGVGLVIVVTLFFFIVLPIIPFFIYYFPVIRHVSTTLALSDVDSLDQVVQSTQSDPRYGEGLAAALDVDVGGF